MHIVNNRNRFNSPIVSPLRPTSPQPPQLIAFDWHDLYGPCHDPNGHARNRASILFSLDPHLPNHLNDVSHLSGPTLSFVFLSSRPL